MVDDSSCKLLAGAVALGIRGGPGWPGRSYRSAASPHGEDFVGNVRGTEHGDTWSLQGRTEVERCCTDVAISSEFCEFNMPLSDTCHDFWVSLGRNCASLCPRKRMETCAT